MKKFGERSGPWFRMIKRPLHFVRQLTKRIIRELLKVSAPRFAALFVVMAVLFSMVIVLAIDFLWDGRFNAELEFAGVVAPFLDSLLLVVLVNAMLDEIREEVAWRERAQESMQKLSLAAELMRKTNVELSLFRSLLDNSSDIILVVDPMTLRYIDVNDRACCDLGYSREELLSMSVYDTDPGINPAARKLIDAQLQKSGSAKFDGIQRRKDGSTFPVEISSKIVNLDKSYILSIVRDITERKQIEAKLTEQLEELRRWHDLTSGREGRILDLKHEVNELLKQTGQHPRYPSAESPDLMQDPKKE